MISFLGSRCTALNAIMVGGIWKFSHIMQLNYMYNIISLMWILEFRCVLFPSYSPETGNTWLIKVPARFTIMSATKNTTHPLSLHLKFICKISTNFNIPPPPNIIILHQDPSRASRDLFPKPHKTQATNYRQQRTDTCW
jgi:hypothetical protein